MVSARICHFAIFKCCVCVCARAHPLAHVYGCVLSRVYMHVHVPVCVCVCAHATVILCTCGGQRIAYEPILSPHYLGPGDQTQVQFSGECLPAGTSCQPLCFIFVSEIDAESV